MRQFQSVLFILGILLMALGAAMVLPAAADAAAGHPDWKVFLEAAAYTEFFGGLLYLANRGRPIEFHARQAFLLTSVGWVAVAAFAALPFIRSHLVVSYTDAFFEAISGLTTTGSTVMTGLDAMPPGILLWRGLLQWLGGIGIIGMAIAVLPVLRVGGMQLYRTEYSGLTEKVLSRPRQIAAAVGAVYLALTIACGSAYWVEGMTAFEAAVHAMTTLASGGYSTSDASLGHFDSAAIDWTATVFMISGALPFTLYVRMVQGRPSALWRDSQVQSFLAFIAAVALVLTVWLWHTGGVSFLDALRVVVFSTVSVVTTTGYSTTDYGLWGGFAVTAFFMLTLVGACTGSTGGGIKMMRFEVMALVLHSTLRRLVHPRGVFPLSYNGRPLPLDVPESVIAFVFVYLAGVALLSLALAALGLDFITSVSGAATAIGNVGPGLGPIIGPAGNFASLPDTAKWLLALGMLMGRLEIFTVLVLLTPSFWRL